MGATIYVSKFITVVFIFTQYFIDIYILIWYYNKRNVKICINWGVIHISLDLGYSLFVSGALIVIKDKGSVKSYAQISLQSKTERSQPAKEASSHATSKCFMFIYFLLPH